MVEVQSPDEEGEGISVSETLQSQQLYAAVLEAALDCIIVMDHEGRIAEFNPAAEHTFGYSRQQAIGQSLAELIVPISLRKQHTQGLKRFLASGEGPVLGKRIEISALHAQGHEFPVELTIVPLEIQGRAHFVGYVRDITELREAKVEMERLLGREKAARAEAEAANRFKDEFLAIVSHELRTPLTPLRGWAELLISKSLDEDSMQQALEAIVHSVDTQCHLVDELLDASSVVQGKLEMKQLDVLLAPLIEEVLQSTSGQAKAKAITLHSHIESDVGVVWIDPSRLGQALRHLVSNSIKFTPTGGQVDVHIASVGPQIQIQVQDNGVGISPSLLPNVFEPLWRRDSSLTRQEGGLGIGLTLVRYIVDMHGGSVRADSAGLEQGTTVTILLPQIGK